MQEYRKKMEEQKRLREKILLEKENRRKRAAMEKQNEDTKNDSNVAGILKLKFIFYKLREITTRLFFFFLALSFVTTRLQFFSKWKYTARNEARVSANGNRKGWRFYYNSTTCC